MSSVVDMPHRVQAIGDAVIHIVDEDEDVRLGFSRLLRAAGFPARVHVSVNAFLADVRKDTWGCVVLDVGDSNLRDQQILWRMAAHGRRLPFVIVSDRDDDDIHGVISRLNAKMFLRKPVDGQALLDAIDWVIRRHEKD